MRLLDPKLLLTAASLVLVTCLVVVDLSSTSPGPLSMAHSRVKGLDEQACERCHGSDGASLAESCNECHVSIGQQLAMASGFHGTLRDAGDCGHCHVEHLGEQLPLVDERTFALAGFEPRERYAHDELAFLLSGAHLELDCVLCHELADGEALHPGEQRFLGASQECLACHADPHEGRMLATCDSCHGQVEPFASLDGFVHGESFDLSGVHASASCEDCHDPGGEYAVDALGGIDAPSARSCAGCHKASHSVTFLAGVARSLSMEVGASCEVCHALDAANFTDYDSQATQRNHSASGFELSAPHEGVECASCHAGPSVTLRAPDDCVACHAGPHGAQFDAGAFAGFECIDCHSRAGFLPATFDAVSHAMTGFSLSEGHAGARCADCHEVQPAAPLGFTKFDAVASECAECHADAHPGFFDGTSCAECHSTAHFVEVVAAQFEHEQRTGFALDGAHEAADCEACHARARAPDSTGRRFGRIAELFGEPVNACSTCHSQVHVGLMAKTGADCATCHTTTDFATPITSAFEHAESTGFALLGAHAHAACEACHVPRPAPDVLGRSFGLASETFSGDLRACDTCHTDPHEGRFDALHGSSNVEGRTGCARCHDERDFKHGARIEFDHGLWTGFELEEAHATASCESCHVSPTTHGLGRTLGASCAACHDDAHSGQFRRRACEDCHQSAASFTDLIFEHGADSRFALDEVHVELECIACHKSWPLAGGGEATRYKPLGVECADCHLGGPR